MMPVYGTTPAFSVPTRRSFTVNDVCHNNTSDKNYVYDGLYTDNNSWAAGHGTSGPHAPYIELDLGANYYVSAVRATPAMSPYGAVNHDIYVGTTADPYANGSYVSSLIDQYGMNMATIAKSFTPTYGRYVRIRTTVSPSWVAWKEIEVYTN